MQESLLIDASLPLMGETAGGTTGDGNYCPATQVVTPFALSGNNLQADNQLQIRP